MAISFIAQVANGLSDQTTRTLSYTVQAGPDRCILVGVTAQNGTGSTLVSGTPTFGGQNMTQEGALSQGSGLRSLLWWGYILEADIITGIMDFSCTFTEEMNRSVVTICQYDGVKQTDGQPFLNTTPSSTTGFSHEQSINVSTDAATELVIDCWGASRADSHVLTAGPLQTNRSNATTSVHSGMTSSEPGTGSSVNMRASTSGTCSNCGIANSLVEAIPVTFLPRMAFFFSLAGLAIPAAMGKILVPTTEQVMAYGT